MRTPSIRRGVQSGFLLAVILVSTPVAPAVAQAARTQSAAGVVPVRIETSRGVITAELDSARAPVTVTNFLRYVDAHAYDDGVFHRTVRADNQPKDSVRIAVIQGGLSRARTDVRFPAIELERTSVTGLQHLDGTLSMARGGPNTATSDFFICIDAQPALDFGGHRNLDGQGFAAFGRVTSGMDVVRAIQQSSANAQSLTPPIAILKVVRGR